MTLTRRASSVLLAATAVLLAAAGPASADAVTCVTVFSLGAGTQTVVPETTRCAPTP